MDEPLISVVIPAFNEEQNIGFVLRGVHEVLGKMGSSYEVIVVDDGSVDKTAEVAKEHNVVLINNGENAGKGSALKAGFLLARGRCVVTMDADGSHQPDDISYLVRPILDGNDVEVAVGSRFVDEMGKYSTTRLHLVGNKMINALILFLTGRYICDSQSGFRAFKRDALRKLALSSSGYEIESEITVKMLKNGFRIREVPIKCRERRSGSTKISSFSDGFKILKALLEATFCS